MTDNIERRDRDLLLHLKVSGDYTEKQDRLEGVRAAVEAARKAGLEATAEELQEASHRFRAERGLQSAEAAKTWLEDRNLELLDLQAYLEREILVEKWKDHLLRDIDPDQFRAAETMGEGLREAGFQAWLETVSGT